MQIQIEKLVHGGSGIGFSDGKCIFVPFTAPGDLVVVEIVEDHGSWAVANLGEIVERSPLRCDPPCPVFGRCGGCQWQHISYPAQLEWKRRILIEAIERIAKLPSPIVLDTLPSPHEWNYRNRIQLHVNSKGKIGFYRPKSKEVIEFKRCLIADERINEELHQRRNEISKRDRGIALRVEEGDGGSFSQVNSAQNGQLKDVISDWLKDLPHERVLELYCGSGNFTFALAKSADRVVASDIDSRAIDAARLKQAQLGVQNIEFIAASAEKSAARFKGEIDAVLIDPPRKGCAEAISEIIRLKPKAIIYISCDPATLARDLRSFIDAGYEFKKSLPVDMFPQTFHVESISLCIS